MISAITLTPENLDAALNETIRHDTIFHVGDTPALLIQHGFDPLPLCTSAKLLNKMYWDHGVIKPHLLRILELISTPQSVYQSEGHIPPDVKTAVLVLTTEEKGELPIVVPIHGGKPVGRRPVNWIASMYAKDNPTIIAGWKARGLLLWTR